MARINLRPEDMALLAQRFDATSDELSKTSLRLEVEIEEALLSSDDEAFSIGRFAERSTMVRARLRRLADEMRVDAGLLSSAAAGGEFSAVHNWLRSLQVLAAGWDTVGSLGSAWSGVARGLGTIMDAVATRGDQRETVMSTVTSNVQGGRGEKTIPVMVDESLAGNSGGLFVSVSTGGDGDVTYLGGLLGQAARASEETEDDGKGDPDWTGVWSRINEDMSHE